MGPLFAFLFSRALTCVCSSSSPTHTDDGDKDDDDVDPPVNLLGFICTVTEQWPGELRDEWARTPGNLRKMGERLGVDTLCCGAWPGHEDGNNQHGAGTAQPPALTPPPE